MDKQGNAHELRQRVDAAVEASKANRFSPVGGKPFQIKFFSTPTPTPTPSGTGPTPTPSPTNTPTRTPRAPTPTPSPTPTKTSTPTPSPTQTPTSTPKVIDFIQLEGMHEHLLLQEDDGRLIIERIPPTPTPTPTPTSSPFPQLCVSGAGEPVNGQYEYGFWSIGGLVTLPGYRLQGPFQTFYVFKNEFNQPSTWQLVVQQQFTFTLDYLYYNTDVSKPTVPLTGWQSLIPSSNPPPNFSSSPCPSQTPFPTSTQTPTPTQTPIPNPFVWQTRVLPVISSWTKLGANPEPGGYYIAIAGTTPLISRSLNGQTWSIEQNASGPLYPAEVEYGNGWFVYVNSPGISFVASNNQGVSFPYGLTFPNGLAGAFDITWGPNGFVVPSNSSTQALVSMDPLTGFSVVNLPFTGGYRNWRCAAYGGGKYVMLGLDGIATGVYSYDAVNWNQFSAPLNSSGRYISVAYGNGRFVAISDLNSEIIYSDDGISWTRLFSPNLIYGAKKIVFGNNKFLIIPNSGQAGAYSFDGITWYSTFLPGLGVGWTDVVFANNRFLLLPSGTGNIVYVYDDNVPTPTPTQSDTPIPGPTSTPLTTIAPSPTQSGTPTPTPTPTPSSTVAIFEDVAANYVTFNNASNQGFGFQPWSITTVNNAGQYLFSTAQRGVGNIDTADKSWASYANPALFNINRLNRTVQTPLTQGQLLSAAVAIAYRNGNKGVRVKEQGTNGRVVWEFAVTSNVYRVSAVTSDQTWPNFLLQNPLDPNSQLPYSQTSIFDVYVYCKAPLVYDIGLHRRGDGLLLTTTLTALADANTFEFYIENTEQGNALNDLYFNSIKVASYVPPLPPPTPTPTLTPTITPPPVQFVCVSGPDQFANGTYSFSTYANQGRPRYFKVNNAAYILDWYPILGQYKWRVLDGGNNAVYNSDGNVYSPWQASWFFGASVAQNACSTPTPTPSPSPTISGTPTPSPTTSGTPTPTPSPTPTPTVTTYAVYAVNFVPLEITNSGLSYNISQFGTNNPSLTCYRGTNYDFIPINLTSHPFALRAALGDTSTAITGTFNNNPNTGIVGSRMYFTPQSSTPNTIYYQCTVHSSMSGVISILDY